MIYQNFALVYDELMKNAPYDEWTSFTIDLLKKYNKNVETIIDLGCGTGEITTRLAKKNFEIYGIDLSADMLAVAMDKSVQRQVNVQWIQQDIVKLNGFQEIDLATSFCDVFNYIRNKKDLLTSFQNIYHSLNESGLFLFDIHNERYAKDKLIDHSFTNREEEIAYIWDCEQGELDGEFIHHLTFFVQQKENTYERFDETHIQRVFPLHIYKDLLKEAGFSILNIYGDFSLETNFCLKNAERIFILAEKRAK